MLCLVYVPERPVLLSEGRWGRGRRDRGMGEKTETEGGEGGETAVEM